jgi:hypothetical protein
MQPTGVLHYSSLCVSATEVASLLMADRLCIFLFPPNPIATHMPIRISLI